MSAKHVAYLWERRISSENHSSDIDPDEDITTLELFPPDKALIQSSHTKRRPRQRISANKPPVPPHLAPGAITTPVEEVPLSDPMLDNVSPVSSFHSSSFLSSEPPSPPTQASSPDFPLEKPSIQEQIDSLKQVLQVWDDRLACLEEMTRRLQARLDNNGI